MGLGCGLGRHPNSWSGSQVGVLEGLFQVKGTKSRTVLVYVWMQWATQAITSRTCAAEPTDVLQVLFEILQARHC